MKKRHLITLAIIAMAISCSPNVTSDDPAEEPGTTEPQDTASSDTIPPTVPWDNALDTTITIPGVPTN